MGWEAVNSLLYDLKNFESDTASDSGIYNLRSKAHRIHQFKSCITSCESFIDVSKIPPDHRKRMEQDIAQYETVKGPRFLVKKKIDPIADSILSHLRLYITALEAEKERITVEAGREKREYQMAPAAPPAQAAPVASEAPSIIESRNGISVPFIDIPLDTSFKDVVRSAYRKTWSTTREELNTLLRIAYQANSPRILEMFGVKIETVRPLREVPYLETVDGKYLISETVRSLDRKYQDGSKKLSFEDAEMLANDLEKAEEIVKDRRRRAEETRLARKFSGN